MSLVFCFLKYVECQHIIYETTLMQYINVKIKADNKTIELAINIYGC